MPRSQFLFFFGAKRPLQVTMSVCPYYLYKTIVRGGYRVKFMVERFENCPRIVISYPKTDEKTHLCTPLHPPPVILIYKCMPVILDSKLAEHLSFLGALICKYSYHVCQKISFFPPCASTVLFVVVNLTVFKEFKTFHHY